ncbi:excinuclease ABC subunit C [bacterium F11]|nr:excinuclease ABC subunit C [bacterium F11]
MYVYILNSKTDTKRFYVGSTNDLKRRLEQHNRGDVLATKKGRPWYIHTALWMHSRDKAIAFEIYLKSHAGRAFQKKHF